MTTDEVVWKTVPVDATLGTMHQGSASNRGTPGVGADDIAKGLRFDARLAKSFIARQRRLRFAPSDPAVAAAEGYRSWCETAWVAFVHREPDTNVDLGAVAQQWRLMAYASDLRDPTHRSQKREWLTLVLMSIGVAAIFLTPSGGVAAVVVCAAAAVVVAYRRNRGGTEVLVVGPDASPRAQRRALWHWDYSDFL